MTSKRSQAPPVTSPNPSARPGCPGAGRYRSVSYKKLRHCKAKSVAQNRDRSGFSGLPCGASQGTCPRPPRAPAQAAPVERSRTSQRPMGAVTARGLPTVRWRVTAGARGRRGAPGCGAGKGPGKGRCRFPGRGGAEAGPNNQLQGSQGWDPSASFRHEAAQGAQWLRRRV